MDCIVLLYSNPFFLIYLCRMLIAPIISGIIKRKMEKILGFFWKVRFFSSGVKGLPSKNTGLFRIDKRLSTKNKGLFRINKGLSSKNKGLFRINKGLSSKNKGLSRINKGLSGIILGFFVRINEVLLNVLFINKMKISNNSLSIWL